MGFPRLDGTMYPPRHWGLCGYAGAGKSTFLAAMRQPLLVVDADGRASEIARLGADVRTLSANAKDHHDPAIIYRVLRHNDTTGIGTVAVDSVTSILQPLIALGIEDNRANRVKNKASSWIPKANALQLVQDALVATGRDFAIIWHYQDGRDKDANPQRKQTLTRVEGNKLVRSINAIIEIGQRGRRRYALITWSRVGKQNILIEDTDGYWAGVPERIEEALYGATQAPGRGPARPAAAMPDEIAPWEAR